MHIVLWDTRHGGVFKDFAGGFGVGSFKGQSWRGKFIEKFYYKNDFRCVAMGFAYLATGLSRQGHTIEYALDEIPAGDVYILIPALMSTGHERDAIRKIHAQQPAARILVLGQVASTLPEAFDELPCQVCSGEPEQLLKHFDAVLESTEPRYALGTVANLDELPIPDWRPFPYQRFGVAYDFWKFPSAYIQSSRGCTLSCSYCPYIILENKVRVRSPELVGEELRHGMKTCGFQSFKFRDPLFGAKRKHALEVVEQIGKLPKKIQFSVESRIELLPPDVLRHLRDVGLTAITVGIESPSRETLLHYKRVPIKDDKQLEFIATCRELGIRVIAGFMIGFPEDTTKSMRTVLRYAKQVSPFAANFNIVTPYPGTGFIDEIREQIDSYDWSRYDVYTPNLKYKNLTPQQLTDFHEMAFRQYYFRWDYLKNNWRMLLPRLSATVQPVLRLFGGSTPTQASSAKTTNNKVMNGKVSQLPILDEKSSHCDAA